MRSAKGFMQLLFSIWLATSSIFSVANYASADTGNLLLESVSLGQFNSGNDDWTALMDAYPQGGFQRDQVGFETVGNRAVKLPGDLSGIYKNGLIARAMPGLDFHKVSFKVKTADVDRVIIRLIDGTGQTFQQIIGVEPDGQWHTVTIDDLDAGDHWGGANDGVWHPTAWAFTIMSDKDHIVKSPNDYQIEVLVDDVQLYVQEQTGEKAISLGQFDLGDDDWLAFMDSYQGGYQQDSVGLETVDANDGNHAAKLPGDLSGIYKNGLIAKEMPGLDVRKLSFKIKSADVDHVLTRLIDATGQTFQQLITIEPDGQWHMVTIDELDAGDHWGGANDGSWHGPAQSFMIMSDKDYIVKSPNDYQIEVLVDDVQLYREKQVPVTLDHLIDDFEQVSDWYYGYGDSPGVVGSYTRTDADAFEGEYSGKLSADFSGGSQYVTMYKIIPDALDVEKLAFWIKTSDYKSVKVRAVDATGQIFQQGFPLIPSGEWQQVVVNQMTSNAYWHGAADGVWHGTMKGFYILLGKDDLIQASTGEVNALIDDVTASYKKADFQINQTTVGNVFVDDETVKFDIATLGDRIDWQVTDYWGNIVLNSSTPVTEGLAELEIQSLTQGYYMLNVTAYSEGVKLEKKSTSFAVLGEVMNLHTVNDSPFGIATHFGQDWSPTMIPLIQKAGIKHIRDEIQWNDVERTPGIYEFRAKYDEYMNRIKDLGIDPLLILAFMNPNYDEGFTPYTDEGREAFGKYATAVLEHYGDQIKRVEVFNEYNIGFSSGPGAQDPEYYYKLLKETYKQVKAYDEDITVIGPVTSQIPWEWLKTLFAQSDAEGKALDYMDAVSVHPYRYPGSPEGMDNDMARLRQLIQTYNDNNTKPIFVSEWGWPTHQGLTGTSEAMEAAYLVRSSVQMLSEGVEMLVWYDLKNDGTDSHEPEHNFGIIRNEADPLGKYAPKPAYVAYSNLTRALTGADFVGVEDISAGIYSYLFERGSEQIRVMWSPSGNHVTLDAEAAVVVTDVVGHETTLSPYNGQVSFNLTEYPIFVRGEVEDIQAGGQFALESAEYSTVGEDIALKLVVDNTSSTQALTAEFVIRGESYEVSAPAGERVEQSVSIPDSTTADQTITISGEVYVLGQRVGLVSSTLRIIDPVSVHAFHTIQEEQDVIRLEITNYADRDFLLEGVELSIDGSDETTVINENIGANTTIVYDIELPSLDPGAYEYNLDINIANYPVWSQSGKLVLVDHDQLTQVSQKTIPIDNDPYVFNTSPTVNLEQDGNFNPLANYSGAADLSGDIWLNWDHENFYLSAEVTDDVHYQQSTDREIWQGDSIQFAVSPGAPGEIENYYEYGIALTPQGPQLYRWTGINEASIQLIDNRELRIVRDDTNHKTIYKLALPWSELSPVKPSDVLFSFSMLVNDNDGAGRRGWAEWGSGIGASKNPQLYQALKFVGPDQSEEPITEAAIAGVTAPVIGAAPVSTLADTSEYTATIAWTPADAAFGANTVYTATITLTPKTGYTLTGVPADFFTVAGATTTTNTADSGVITAVFPATGGWGQTDNSAVVILGERSSNDGKATISAGSSGTANLHNKVKVIVPAGAWNTAFKLMINETSDKDRPDVPKHLVLVGAMYDITKDMPGNFDKPVTLRIAIDPVEAKGQTLLIYYYDEAKKEWIELGGTISDGFISVEVDHFTTFAVFGKAESDLDEKVNFTDVAGHWAVAQINEAVKKGMINGYTDGTFRPGGIVTRAEFAVMVSRALQLPAGGDIIAFADADQIPVWAQDAIASTVRAGIVQGYTDLTFAPKRSITRAEMAAMIARAAGFASTASETSYADNAAIASWAKGSIASVADAGLMNGKGNNQFAPNDETTRAEAVTVILKLIA